MRQKMKLSIFMLAVLLFLIPAKASAAAESDISRQLICQCGCNMVLLNCSHVECHSQLEMTTLISQQIDQGKSEKQIIQSFVTQYGEQVLATPPKRGFNLTAWVLPFAALLFGGGEVYFTLKKGVEHGRHPQVSAATTKGDDKYRLQLEEELKKFTGRNFR